MPASTRRYDLLCAHLEGFMRMLPGVESGNIRAVHGTRVASRRLRELLPVLQLDHAVTRKLGRRLRKLSRRLGRLRELDVLMRLIDELADSGRLPGKALRRVGDEVRKARDEARGRLSHQAVAVDLRRAGRKLEALTAEVEHADRGQLRARGWRWAVEARAARRAAKLATAIERAGAMYTPERLHAVRIALKQLRYGVELSAEAAGMKKHADLRALKRWQGLLGRLCDLQVLMERVRHLQASLVPPDITAWRELDALLTALENSCRRLHARYVHDRAAMLALCDRLGARPSSSGRSIARRIG